MATSTPPYLFPASQATVRASVCGYHRRDFDLAVTWFAPDEHASIAGSIATTVREPATSLAALDSLPLELIHATILQMDVRTAFHFRQINLRARQVVNQLHEYKIVAAHALNGFCALLRTGTAERITLAELYHCICTDVCSICKGKYGNLVQLLTLSRCCSSCLKGHARELCVTSVTNQRKLMKSPKSLGGLPIMKTLPGIYSMDEKHYTRRVKIVPTEAALGLCANHEVDVLDPDKRQKLNSKPYLDYMACCAVQTYDLGTRDVQSGVCCAGCQLAVEMAGGSDNRLWELRDLVYSYEGLLQHLEICKPAQLIWKASENGTRDPPNMPHFCETGGWFSLRT